MKVNQPKILLDGKEYPVASIWWDSETGIISHVTYHTENTVETVFGPESYLSSLFIG